uniref:Fibronectin type-III domain-containing protein n=1 Tax=candidate division CPR3 bacterium TaxID=2268181 RepID=A0A7C4M3J6_UNCC3
MINLLISIIKNKISKKIDTFLVVLFLLIGFFSFAGVSLAAEPTGDDWFQLITNRQTGSDNTGDGGNYYYVGQTFRTNIQIKSDSGTSASNIWIDYDTGYVSASALLTGSFFPNWSGQTIFGGRIKSTGYRTSGFSYGLGDFGSVDFTALAPTAANYSNLNPTFLDINIGNIGETGESNISKSGLDLLDDAEDFYFNIWADTVKPYAKNNSPSSNFNVSESFNFILCDSKNGESGDGGNCLFSGVGTGVNTSTPPGYILINDGSLEQNFSSLANYNCLGTWATNQCNAFVGSNVSPGDGRKWKYNTNYTVKVGGYLDKASSNQNQLGDTNGPNEMNEKIWTFLTEPDLIKPQVVSESPTRGSSGNSINTNITIDILDKKDYSGNISGSGINPNSCKINISSSSVSMSTYQQSNGNVSISPINFGFRFSIDPNSDFAQNETVSVSVYDCTDFAGNIMVTDNYTFNTADFDTPYVDGKNPDNDQNILENGKIMFHIKDDGVGVDLSNIVIYVNGVYYTDDGSSGSVTNSGTKINYLSSLNFNGGNYAGDTTSVSGGQNDYYFTIDPQNNFVLGESVPVIIYAKDLSGNIMEREIYAFSVGSSSVASGSAYCGSNTTWNGAYCVGSSSSCSSSGGGVATINPEINETTISIVQVDEKSVLLSWFSNMKSSAWVVYDTVSPSSYGTAPKFSYSFSTPESNDDSLYHSVLIGGLKTGTLYYFRPVIKSQGMTFRGPELKMAPRFATNQIECAEEISEKIVYQDRIVYRDRIIQPNCPVYQVPDVEEKPGEENKKEGFEIGGVNSSKYGIEIFGSCRGIKKIKITLYLVSDSIPEILEVDCGVDEKWYGKIEKKLTPGSYAIVVEDESEKIKRPVVFYVKAPPGLVKKISDKVKTEPVLSYLEILATIILISSFIKLILISRSGIKK